VINRHIVSVRFSFAYFEDQGRFRSPSRALRAVEWDVALRCPEGIHLCAPPPEAKPLSCFFEKNRARASTRLRRGPVTPRQCNRIFAQSVTRNLVS
jgi:hypothetical protein